jgi:hypothetical protein
VLKTLVRSGLAMGIAMFAARQLVYGGRDLIRYNKMREMSGDPPLGVPTRKPDIKAPVWTTNPFVMLAGMASDVTRYLRMKSM